MKKKLTIPDNVDDFAIDDNEKAGVKICVDAKKTVQLRLLRKPWKTERRRNSLTLRILRFCILDTFDEILC